MVNYAPLDMRTHFSELWTVRAFRLNFIGGVILMLMASSLTYIIFDTQPPYTYIVKESGIIPPTAKGGDQVIVMWRVIFHRSCPGSNQRILFDPVTKVILASYDPAPAATTVSLRDGYLNRTFLLPKNIQPGWVGYRAVVTYQCNFLQRFWPLVVTTPDLFFKVEE